MPVPEVTENFIRIRQVDPKKFTKMRTIWLSRSQGIKAIVGRMKGKTTTTIQSYLFVKKKWTLARAKKWVKAHKKSLTAINYILALIPESTMKETFFNALVKN